MLKRLVGNFCGGHDIMMTDPIADMITRIRNGLSNEATFVDIPVSKLKIEVAAVMQREGFIWDYEIKGGSGVDAVVRINLKYGPSGERVVRSLRRVSRPGRRVYFAVDAMPRVLGGLGIMIVSTNRGLLSSREASSVRVGGEALIEIW